MLIDNFKIWTWLANTNAESFFGFWVVIFHRRTMVIFDHFVVWMVNFMVFFNYSRFVILNLVWGSMVILHWWLMMILHWWLMMILNWFLVMILNWMMLRLYVIFWVNVWMPRLSWIVRSKSTSVVFSRKSFSFCFVSICLHLSETLLLSVDRRGSVVIWVALRWVGMAEK